MADITTDLERILAELQALEQTTTVRRERGLIRHAVQVLERAVRPARRRAVPERPAKLQVER